jgi:hypothetical protein
MTSHKLASPPSAPTAPSTSPTAPLPADATAAALTRVGERAAALLSTRGWSRLHLVDERGAMCAHGALQQACAEVTHPGDYPVLSMVFIARGVTRYWNSHPFRTPEEVQAALSRHPVTDAELAAALGPRWPVMVGFLRRVHDLFAEGEPTQIGRLVEAVQAAGLIPLSCSHDARFGAQAVALLTATGTSFRGPFIPEEVVARLWRLAQLSTIVRGAAAAAVTAPTGPGDTARERAALLAGLSWSVVALQLREELRSTPATAGLYELMSTPWRRAAGPLHPADDAAGGHDDELQPDVDTAALTRLGALLPAACPACAPTAPRSPAAAGEDPEIEPILIAGYPAEHAIGQMTFCAVPAWMPDAQGPSRLPGEILDAPLIPQTPPAA